MSNNNLNNCIKALQILNMLDVVKVQSGKNPKQATRLIFQDGKSISVSAVTTVNNFIELLQADKTSNDNSIAKSKHNNCNSDEEAKELQMWLERMATYAKKCCYDYENESLANIITWSIEDFGYTQEQVNKYHQNWNTEEGWRANTKYMIKCLGKYTPITVLQNTIKQWLSNHQNYAHLESQIDLIIKRFVEVKGV